jgi:hypothetical protein
MMVCCGVSGKVVASKAPVFGQGMCIQIHPRIIVDDSCVISEGEILDFDKGDNRRRRSINLGNPYSFVLIDPDQFPVADDHAVELLSEHERESAYRAYPPEETFGNSGAGTSWRAERSCSH